MTETQGRSNDLMRATMTETQGRSGDLMKNDDGTGGRSSDLMKTSVELVL
jgi:hypothetical protein